ncbi:hypothetical protein jhhlp_004567 [Lomentospora prolificans]|uniref:Uncharacterized protein n=1 Tax=Lomentospora prolificans TaxID=41688 RepID=A0A2N3NBX2_9PEZI|nr:hypothetical protein jhhlp_004567 [Lomentospora prolificans]
MTDQTYITPVSAHQDCHGLQSPILDGSRQPAPQACSTYPEVPYTAAVSPFAYPASCEPNLLTPISSASSPPMQHTTKFVQHYTTSPTLQGHQQPTPPATSQMFWAPTFDVSTTTSQSGSPMPTGAHDNGEEETHFGMAYVPAEASQDDIPEPPPPYFGHFGVSSRIPTEDDFYPAMDVHPHMIGRHPHQADQHRSHPQISVQEPPMMHSDLPLHPPQNPQVHALPQAPGLSPNSARSPYTPHAYPAPVPSPRASRSKLNRVSKKPNKQKSRMNTNRPDQACAGASSRASERRELTDQIQFKPGIPHEETYLLELRMKFRDTKGKTMWDQIGEAFAARFGKRPEKAALQMKLTRAKQRWVIWPTKDVSGMPHEELLRELYFEDEKERYQRIATKFNERGGGANLGFNANNIECKLVEMGLEDIWINPDTKIRPRRRPARERGGRVTKVELELQRQQYMHPFPVELTNSQREELYKQVDSRAAPDEDDTALQGSSNTYTPGANILQSPTGIQHPADNLNQYYPQHQC